MVKMMMMTLMLTMTMVDGVHGPVHKIPDSLHTGLLFAPYRPLFTRLRWNLMHSALLFGSLVTVLCK